MLWPGKHYHILVSQATLRDAEGCACHHRALALQEATDSSDHPKLSLGGPTDSHQQEQLA